MTFLISQIALFLAIAMLIGGVAGWLLSQSSERQKLEESQERLEDARKKRRRSDTKRQALETKAKAQEDELALAQATASELREALEQQRARVSTLEKLRHELDSALKGAEIKLEEERRGRVQDKQALEQSRIALQHQGEMDSVGGINPEASALRTQLLEAKSNLALKDTQVQALKDEVTALGEALAQAQRTRSGADQLEDKIAELKEGLARRERLLRAREVDHLELQARLLNEQEAAARERESAEAAARELRLSLSRQIAALDAFQGSH